MAEIQIHIDKDSGFCFGVVNAIEIAERELKENGELYCLGDIVHNNMEVERLQKKGLKIISHEELKKLKNVAVLIRAHGEPPITYKTAYENNIRLIDASCPVVLQLQNAIRLGFEEAQKNGTQLVIYGKKGHAEVIGLEGQVFDKAMVVNELKDLQQLDFSIPIYLYSQTTQSLYGYQQLIEAIKTAYHKQGYNPDTFLKVHHSICSKVSNRSQQIKEFVKEKDLVFFVSGRKSSNGRVLFEIAKSVNDNTHFISSPEEISNDLFLKNITTIGICGATSTPKWLMEETATYIKTHFM